MLKPISSRRTALLIALLIGFAVFAVSGLSDILLINFNYHPWLALVDDMMLGAFAAGLVLYYEWRRHVELRRKLDTIAEMNHHVRNQLEIIEYSAWTTHDQAHIARMHESVARIEWALRQILGNVDHTALPPVKAPVSIARPTGRRDVRQSAE
jgi:hypothetical protein